jgi:hypothetical protein
MLTCGDTSRRPGLRARLRNVLRETLPSGTPLRNNAWRFRHHMILTLLWVHAIGLLGYGILTVVRDGNDALHVLTETASVVVLAALASTRTLSRAARAIATTLGLLTSSALLVHLSGGVIEMHFHFFIMIAVVTLYQSCCITASSARWLRPSSSIIRLPWPIPGSGPPSTPSSSSWPALRAS